MSIADNIFIENCKDILKNGVWDTGYPVRPVWEDGTAAHTIKKFCLVNRYDLQAEFPIVTLRKTGFKNCIDELLWIWQKKSNNINDLKSHIWDAWADENNTIGKAYGYQLGVKHKYPEGMFDQVDRVIYDLKNNPTSRRILTNIYNHADLNEMQLYPCAYSVTFNVSGNKLNAILNQRSQDMLVANNWNVCQYAVLVYMLAQVSGMDARGTLADRLGDAVRMSGLRGKFTGTGQAEFRVRTVGALRRQSQGIRPPQQLLPRGGDVIRLGQLHVFALKEGAHLQVPMPRDNAAAAVRGTI